MTFIESTTAVKRGWGSDKWRHVSGLTKQEREAVRNQTATVWFRITKTNHMQSGYKIVTWSPIMGYDSREPNNTELTAIQEG